MSIEMEVPCLRYDKEWEFQIQAIRTKAQGAAESLPCSKIVNAHLVA